MQINYIVEHKNSFNLSPFTHENLIQIIVSYTCNTKTIELVCWYG